MYTHLHENSVKAVQDLPRRDKQRTAGQLDATLDMRLERSKYYFAARSLDRAASPIKGFRSRLGLGGWQMGDQHL